MYDKAMGEYCKRFRVDILGIPLKDFASFYGDNVKNINAFEAGRANNIKYLIYYMYYDDAALQDEFLHGLSEVLSNGRG